MAKVINIKNGTTKTLTIKKNSVINFADLSTDSDYGILSNFSFKRSGKNLIIQNSSANINITVKNYFTTKNHGAYTKSKLEGLLFNGAYQIGMAAGKIQQRADYKAFEFDANNNSAYATLFWDTIDLSTNTYKSNENLNIYTGVGKDTIKFGATNLSSSTRTVYAGNDTNPIILNLEYLGTNKIKDVSISKGSLVFKSNTGKETYVINKYISKGKDNVQIKLNDQDAASLKDYLNNTINVNFTMGNSKSKKKQTIKGNILNNTLEGGTKADKIYCVDGNNTVTGRGGNDKIYAGKGADTFKYVFGNGWGKDIIYSAGSTDKIQFTDISYDDSALSYVKSGNNLVINAYGTVKGKWKILDKITLANYFKNKDRLGYINNTAMKDIAVTVNAKGTQNLGTGKYNIYLTKKNSTVSLDKSADATIVLSSGGSYNPKTRVEKYWYQTVSYNDSAVAPTKKGNDLTIKYYTVSEKYSYKTHKLKRSAKANYITLKDYFSTDLTSAGRGKSNINISNAKINYDIETQNVKQLSQYCDYIHLTSTNNLDKTDLQKGIKNYRIDSIDSSLVDVSYWVTGSKKNDRITITNSQYNYIDSRGGNDIIHTDGGTSGCSIMYSSGFDNCITGTSNDTYYVGAILNSIDKFKKKSFTKNSKLLVNDKGGNEDKMYISAKSKDLRIMLNINKDGKVVTNQTEALLRSDNKYTDSLLIFNKSALTGKNVQKMIKSGGFNGAIEIDNWFGVGSSTSSAVAHNMTTGQGRIEKIYDTNGKELDMTNWITQVKNDVVGWLTTGTYGGKYDSVADVLNSGNSKAINSLIAVFTKAAYR